MESAGCLRFVDAAAAVDAIVTVSGTRLGDVTSSERRRLLFRSKPAAVDLREVVP